MPWLYLLRGVVKLALQGLGAHGLLRPDSVLPCSVLLLLKPSSQLHALLRCAVPGPTCQHAGQASCRPCPPQPAYRCLSRQAQDTTAAGAVLSQVSTVLGAAVPSERADGAWSEGVAIWVAVAVVSLVGECSATQVCD